MPVSGTKPILDRIESLLTEVDGSIHDGDQTKALIHASEALKLIHEMLGLTIPSLNQGEE
jgi:hypothetical protein